MTTLALPPIGTYQLDPRASTIEISMRAMLGLLPVRGTFALLSGVVDVHSPTAATVSAVADAASFESGIAKRDTHVKSADFLDVAHHPRITFESMELVAQAGQLRLRGTLTALESAPVEFTITSLRLDSDAGFTALAHSRLDREALGVRGNGLKVGRHLDVTVTVHAHRSPAQP